MASPELGTGVLYKHDADTPDQYAVVVGVGVVDDEEHGTHDTDVWLTVFPAAAAPYATPLPVPFHADGKPNTWRHPAGQTPAAAQQPAAADQAPADGDAEPNPATLAATSSTARKTTTTKASAK